MTGTKGSRPHRWGGVAGMAAACTLAVLVVVQPLRPDAQAPATLRPPPGLAVVERTSARDACDTPGASLLPSPDSGPAVDRIKERGKLNVGVDQNSYLWGYRDPFSGDIEGFDIDLVRAIARDILGDPDAVTFKTVPTNQRFEAIRKGDVDMVVRTVTINCTRIEEEKISFSTAYFQAGQQLLVPLDSDITAFGEALRGKRVCTAEGSTGQSELEKESHGAEVLLVPNQLDCLVQLQLGFTDAVFTDNALAAGQAAQDPGVRLVGRPVTEEYYGVAMNKPDDDLVRRVNKVLEDYRAGGADSAWTTSYEEWLEDDLPGLTGPPDPL